MAGWAQWRAAPHAAVLVLGVLGFGCAAPALAQDGTTAPYTCAQFNTALAGQQIPFGTAAPYNGGPAEDQFSVALQTVPGDRFTFTLSSGVVPGSYPPGQTAATFIDWHLEMLDPSQQPPTATPVATGGTLNSTLTYAHTTTAQLVMLRGAIDRGDGFGTLTARCTHVDPSLLTPTAVPTLGEMALGALALLMAVATWRRGAPRQR
ncbi:hypothetical protein [Ottowia sp.]|uniref:hypothetical protein n=1 Tax=Ottowia sp. TaxID=1898956 RepID=UPI002C5C70DE|nr:hypothetical protein [Ottowia sp.]HOB65098.1 hypothetical protein [Ottowia sp.]HPZ56267.1 hypothetical protein [Ottowia sp.]HQD46567.1 hypothetical protein [Ottowia sp.]